MVTLYMWIRYYYYSAYSAPMNSLQSALTCDGQFEEVDEQPGVVLDEQLGEVVQRMMQSDAAAVVAHLLLLLRARTESRGFPPPPLLMNLVITCMCCIRIDIQISCMALIWQSDCVETGARVKPNRRQ